ncbi:enoyl-CoA hydratase/isomerase family protein [Saccharopolyspora sp. HNM0983]|uniref:Enoyl-CoA hydratase/isomerase family protein n=1 Tax=Saccharopolyspora montiporae TaxID=2781240 RepID=A0A929FYA3_9PSEU|nr:enoyl-CoA hydratase/isomerase family protein [Saccharopolyspora sp. HNM0983]MBE9373280.1 enoyl-CoA hydratase/isomerase family protein [Saccharopolyspora sp. HNM0983]
MVSFAEFAVAARAPLFADDGRIVDPLLVVELDTPVDELALAEAVRAARSSDRVLIGLTGADRIVPDRRELVAALDLALGPPELAGAGPMFAVVEDPGSTAARLRTAAEANPQAALVLAQVLRTTADLAVPGALDVESLAYSTLLGGTEFRRWLDARGHRPAPPETPEPVLATRSGDELHIRLNIPERRNAHGALLRDALVEALAVAEHDDTVTRIVLDGAGRSFCAGGDLDEFGSAPDPATAHFVRTRAGAGLRLHRLAERTRARVHGACVGAGIELAAFAGHVIADPAATFRLPEVGMGLIPGAGGTVGIPRRIGRRRALLLALSGEPLDAATALDWGLVDELAPIA